jgi:hypothetical protein
MATEFELGLLTGLLVGEGHFGGDGRQPQVTLRMHVRHEAIFRWLERTFPGGKLYGPYNHGGRHYFQWMARGPFLRDYLVPMLETRISPDFDAYSHQRFQDMRLRYAKSLQRSPVNPDPGSATTPGYDSAGSTMDRRIVARAGGRAQARPGAGAPGRSDEPTSDMGGTPDPGTGQSTDPEPEPASATEEEHLPPSDQAAGGPSGQISAIFEKLRRSQTT